MQPALASTYARLMCSDASAGPPGRAVCPVPGACPAKPGAGVAPAGEVGPRAEFRMRAARR